MNYANIKYCSTTNGTGIRTSVFVSGCRIHCKGCFNKQAWDFNYGKEFTDGVIERILDSIEPVYCSGLTILGGEPLDPNNIEGVDKLIEKFRERFGKSEDKTIWLYTGYKFEELTDTQLELLKYVDVLVDGEFIENEKVLDLRFRGSLNQRIIDVKETFEKHRVVLWEDKSGYY